MSVFLKRFINNKELMSFAFLKSWNHLFWNKIYFEWFAETIYHMYPQRQHIKENSVQYPPNTRKHPLVEKRSKFILPTIHLNVNINSLIINKEKLYKMKHTIWTRSYSILV